MFAVSWWKSLRLVSLSTEEADGQSSQIAVGCCPELQSSGTAESASAVGILHSSMNAIPSILQSENIQTQNLHVTEHSLGALHWKLQLGAKHKRSERRQCVAVVFPDERGEEKRVRPCLLSSHWTNVLLIGVEGFPHSGFRHFIRYINIRGVTPEEQGEGKEEESRKQIRDTVVGDLRLRERCQHVSCTGCLENRPPHPNKTSTHTDRQEGEMFLS